MKLQWHTDWLSKNTYRVTNQCNVGYDVPDTDKRGRPILMIYNEFRWRCERRNVVTLHMLGSCQDYSGLTEASFNCEIFGYISLSAMKWSCQHQLSNNPVWNLHSQSYRHCMAGTPQIRLLHSKMRSEVHNMLLS